MSDNDKLFTTIGIVGIIFYAVVIIAIIVAIIFVVGYITHHNVLGITYSELLAEHTDPDSEIYKHNPAHWSEELNYYQEQLNKTMYPVCCNQFPK